MQPNRTKTPALGRIRAQLLKLACNAVPPGGGEKMSDDAKFILGFG